MMFLKNLFLSLFFSFFTSFISLVSLNRFSSQLFADDVYIFFSFLLFYLSFTLEKLNLCLNFIFSRNDFIHLKLNSSKFTFNFLSRSESLPFSFPLITNTSELTIHPFSTIHGLVLFLNSSFSFKLQILFIAFSCFYYLHRIRQIFFTLMMPLLRFLPALLFSAVLITATLYTIILLNLPSIFLLKLSTLLQAWSLILLSFFISLYFLLVFTGYLSLFIILILVPFFHTFDYLLNVLAHGPLLALNSSLYLLIPTLILLFLILVHFSGTLFLRISNLFFILFLFIF